MYHSKYATIDNLTIYTQGVEKSLQKLKIYKASGPENLSAFIFRETSTELAPVLTVIFNMSLKTGTLPEDWHI